MSAQKPGSSTSKFGSSSQGAGSSSGHKAEFKMEDDGRWVHKGPTVTLKQLKEKKQRESSRSTGNSKQKFCHFGKTRLPLLKEGEGYRPLTDLPVDISQKCLLDSIWNANTRKDRLNVCCALQYYFSKIIKAPLGKNFSYYALADGKNPGIYCHYSSLCIAKNDELNPRYKGFYSFTEAFDFLLDHLDENTEVTIEKGEEQRYGLLHEVQNRRIRDLEDEVQALEAQIREMISPTMEPDESHFSLRN